MNQLDEDILRLSSRFDKISLQESSQRRLINSLPSKNTNFWKKQKIFNALANNAFKKTNIKKMKSLANDSRLMKIRDRRFFQWRNKGRRRPYEITKLRNDNQKEFESNQKSQMETLFELKRRILEAENEIAVVEEATREKAQELSRSYVQAIGVLNSELINLQNSSTCSVKSRAHGHSAFRRDPQLPEYELFVKPKLIQTK